MKTTMIYLLASAALCVPARAFADLNFDATQVAPDQGIGDPLPTGWYNVAIDESEMKPTNDGAGTYLKLRFDVLDGQFKGRKLWEQLNLKNANAQTVEIAQKQLSAICHAVGVLKPAKSEELHGIPLKVRVGQKKAEGGYDAGNKITSYKNVNEKVDMAGGDAGAAAFGAASPGAPPPADNAQPWAAPPAAAAVDTAPPAPTPPAPPVPAPAAPAAPAVAHDPIAAAEADGWIQHPSSPTHMYKGQDVKTKDELAAMFPAPAAPAVPEAPAVPPAPPVDAAAAAAATTAPPPWAKPAE